MPANFQGQLTVADIFFHIRKGVVRALLYVVFWLGPLGLIDNFRAIRGHMTYYKRCGQPSRSHCYWGKEHLSWEPCEACRIAACVVERLRQP